MKLAHRRLGRIGKRLMQTTRLLVVSRCTALAFHVIHRSRTMKWKAEAENRTAPSQLRPGYTRSASGSWRRCSGRRDAHQRLGCSIDAGGPDHRAPVPRGFRASGNLSAQLQVAGPESEGSANDLAVEERPGRSVP